jgi:hypothetical protein
MSSESLRFVVLRHEGVGDPHFDLMLEIEPGGKLATWRSPRWPIDRPTELHELGAHRRDYLQYQGEISGGRGSVRRVAEGTYCRVENGQRWRIQFIDPANFPPIVIEPLAPPHWRAASIKKDAAKLSGDIAAPREGGL